MAKKKKKVQRGPIYPSLISPVITSYVTIVQYQNQEIYTGTDLVQISSVLHAFICVCVHTCMCTCVVLCKLMFNLCNYHYY